MKEPAKVRAICPFFRNIGSKGKAQLCEYEGTRFDFAKMEFRNKADRDAWQEDYCDCLYENCPMYILLCEESELG